MTTTTSRTETQRVFGQRGLSIWGGTVTEEYLTELRPWSRAVRVYLEMRDDAVIGTLLDAIKMPLMAAEFQAEPAGDTEADAAAADFLWQNLNSMVRQTWRDHVEDALEFLDFGFAIGEIILEKRDDGRLWLRNIEPRGQETLRRWELQDDHPSAFVQSAQLGAMVLGIRTIPLDKCVHPVFRGRKGNPQGTSILRSVYRTWKYLKNFENFEGIGVERDVGGMPVAILPEEPLTAADLTDLKNALAGLRVDEEAYLILPKKVTVTPYAAGQKSYDIRDVIRDKQKEILMRLFAQFLVLGMDKVGTQALVQGSQDFFGLALRSVQEELLETWNQQLVPFLFRFNLFPGMTALPHIIWGRPGKPDIGGLLDAYGKGVAARLITPIRDDEQRTRALLDLPDLPEGIGEEPREVQPAIGFQEPSPTGEILRRGRRPLVTATNRYQRELMEIYDAWATETLRLATLPGRTPADITPMVDARLEQLRQELLLAGRKHISEAKGLGLGRILGKRASSPEVIAAVGKAIARNEGFVNTSLMPDLRARFIGDITAARGIGDLAAQRELVRDSLNAPRARVASYAGGAVVAAFEVQTAAGEAENAERLRGGEPPVAVRWVLDPTADHCQDDPTRGTFGCPSLAREYPGGWSELPTTPAGNVSCLSNCRCTLQINLGDGKGWIDIT